MLWPRFPHDISEIPTYTGDIEIFHLSESAKQTLTDFVRDRAEILDEITDFNRGKEALLGGLIIELASMISNNEQFKGQVFGENGDRE